MKVFYQCDKSALCSNSILCGTECNHTTNRLHCVKRATRSMRIFADGDLWEDLKDLARNKKDLPED